jgi:hypothetical protein
MANNAEVTLNFKVATDGSLQLVTKNIDKAAKSSDNLAASQKKVAKGSDEVNYKLNQGIIGTSSAAKSFSKLDQAIGNGSNGLVGAYATLAANAFAVSAAFNTLRSAAQVEQMMKGLEVQGARTGRNLKGLAEDLQALTNYSISAAEAMEATALMTSAGFKSQGIKDLTTVANNAALALGRNLPDALDRISKGVTKLEPELLDELGIMTKLSEAQSMYALQTNKSVDSLTAFEKRQAMLNAVVAEGTAKFGGLSEQVSANPYDQLAATFSNLVKNILSSLNTVLGPIAAIFGGNQTLLLGGLILFVSTIRKQLLPIMYELGDMARKRSEDLIQVAEASKKAANAALLKAKADREATLESKRASLAESKLFPAKLRVPEIQKGTLSGDELKQEMAKLDNSIKRREGNIQKGFATAAKTAIKEEELNTIKNARNLIKEIYDIQISGEKAITGALSAKKRKQLDFISEKRAAQAEDRKATAIELASTGKISSAWQKASESVRKYKQSVQAASQERRVGPEGNIKEQGFVGRQFDGLKVLGNRVSTFAQVGAAAFMNFLPAIGTATAALAGAWSVYEKFIKSDAAKAHEEALKKLKETLDSTAMSVKELNRLNSLSIPLGVKAAQVLTIQSESTAEIARAFEETLQAKAKAETNTSTDSLYKALFGTREDATRYATGIVAGPFLDQARKELESSNAAFIGENFFRGLGKLGGPIIEETFADFGKRVGIVFAESLPTELGGFDQVVVQSARAMYQFSQILDKDLYDSLIKSYGGLDKVAASPALQQQFIKEAAKAYDGLADSVKQLQESFKATGDSIKSYYQNLLPKTSFDAMITGFEAVNKELFNIERKLAGGGIDKQFALLTSMPDEIKFTLGIDQIDALNQAQKLNESIALYRAEITRINADESITAENKKKQVDLQNTLIAGAEAEIKGLSTQGAQIKEQLKSREGILKNYQEQEILLKSQQNMHNAIMKAEQEFYDLSAAGVARKIDMENQSIRMQQAQLKIQASMIQVDINKQKLLLSEINSKIQLLGIEDKITKERALQNEIQAKEAKAAAGQLASKSGVTDARRVSIENLVAKSTEEQLLSQQLIGTAAEKAFYNAAKEQKLAEVTLNRVTQRDDIMKSIRIAQTAFNALQKESAALEKSIVSEETKALEANKYNLKLRDDIVKKEQELEDISLATQKSLVDINAILTNRQDLISSNILNGIKENKLEKDKLLAQKESLRLSTENEKKRLISLNQNDEITQEAITNLDTLSGLESKILDKKLEQLKVSNQLTIYQALLGNGIEDSLSKLQSAIALEQKRLDLVSETADKQTKIAQMRSEISIIRTGGTVDEKTQKQFAAENAKLALEVAGKTYELRIASIDAEYDLIEAKRKIDEDNFKVQALLIRSLWEVYNGPGEMSESLKKNVSLIEDAATRVQNVDTSAMRALAKQGAFQDLTLARLNYQKATAERDALGRSGMGSVFANRQAQRESVAREISTKISPFEQSTLSYNKANLEQVKSTVASLIAIDENTETLPERLAEIINPVSTEQKGQTLSKQEAMQQAMKMAKDVGAKSWQYGAQTGHEGEGHKDFRAIDVYAAPKNQEVTNPALKAKFDNLAIDYAQRGYIVIWNKLRYELDRETGKIMTTAAKGHTTHMHVEAGKTGQITGSAITSAAKEAGDIIRNSIVTGADLAVIPVAANAEQTNRASDIVDRAKTNSESSTISVNAPLKTEELTKAPSKLQKALEDISDAFQESINTMDTLAGQMTERLGQDFGAQGNIIKSLGGLMSNISVKLPNIGAAFDGIKEGTILWKQGNKEIEEVSNTTYDSVVEKAQAMQKAQEKSKEGFSQMATSAGEAFASISAIIGAVGSILKASSDAKIANIDKEIAAEQKRDGKSAQSLAKIEAMEKKKDSIARKAFNVQKKLMMAQAVMSTAAAVAMTLGQTGGFGIPLAIAVGAMGAAQLAIIAGTQYESAYAPKAASMPSTLSIGKRDNSVDLARGSNANAGGEVGYLRGAQGTGTNAGNYRTIGSAYGGELMRGYGNRGFVVGEKGPEVITPDTPITVTPANESSQAQSINASFNIQALDASGVQDILVNQKGNIIKMLRDAANASGQGFMEDVNVNVYTRPSVGKL